MEIRDPIHGSIHILDEFIPIIRHDFFQRLRNIKQLGLSEYVFPGATHSRFLHSIGVMSVGTRAFDKLFADKLHKEDFRRLKETFKLACLLHDIGHAPLSHSTEFAMPVLGELKLPSQFWHPGDKAKRQATHEDYTIKAIVDSSFSDSFKEVEKSFGVDKECVAYLIMGVDRNPDYFTVDNINYFPILHQLVSSEIDCDRMDYLLRDSYFCGVSYGNFDLDWLLDNLGFAIIENKAFLGISERSVITFDDFLLSRYHMFIMVYFHYRSVCLEQLLLKYFKSSPDEYKIPATIEDYLEHDDHYLMKTMRRSKNPYAIDLVKNQIPLKIFEAFNQEQKTHLLSIQKYLDEENIDYIRSSSAGRLSKYYNEHSDNIYAIKVIRKLYNGTDVSFLDINDATKLFEKYSKSHSIDRLHCNIDLLPKVHQNKISDIINT